MEIAELERRTREAFPEWAGGALRFDPIEKGGSGRVFVRVTEPASGASVVAMHYGPERPDNLRFAAVTDFLAGIGAPVPALRRRREDLGLLWMEDLGGDDLGALAAADWAAARRPACEAALRAVLPLHRVAEAAVPAGLPALEPPFDEALYRWEQEYFLEHFAARFLPGEVARRLGGDAALHELRRSLSAEPRCLVHRDFQSTNVMLRGGAAVLVDYQGMRWGLAEYDLASLLYDPYTDFEEGQREELAAFYLGLRREAGLKAEEEGFRERLRRCACQRLMQALGAYGYLAEVKGRREFLRHIPAARRRLARLAAGPGGVPALAEALAGGAEEQEPRG